MASRFDKRERMRDWYIKLEVTHLLADPQALQERLYRAAEALREYGAVATWTDDRVTMRMHMPAGSADRAVEKAKNLFSLSLVTARIPYTSGLMLAHAEPIEEASLPSKVAGGQAPRSHRPPDDPGTSS